MAMTTKKMMDAYNERQKKQVSKSENTNLNTNKSGGKSPARLAAEAKKAKLMSEVGTNKTNTKSVQYIQIYRRGALSAPWLLFLMNCIHVVYLLFICCIAF